MRGLSPESSLWAVQVSAGRLAEAFPSGRSHDIFQSEVKSASVQIAFNEQRCCSPPELPDFKETHSFKHFLEKKANLKSMKFKNDQIWLFSSVH